MRYVALAVVLLLAACGGTAKPKPVTTSAAPRVCPKTQRALARLTKEIAAIDKASRTTKEDSPQINAATDRFLNDVATAPVGNLKRNRLIDHAMGALHGQCEQCFQALEAGRPIPSIRYGGSKPCT
jgi:Flp pilus assembly protein TadD